VTNINRIMAPAANDWKAIEKNVESKGARQIDENTQIEQNNTADRSKSE
jgi:hypothetical protein